jgi:hypothetical protein
VCHNAVCHYAECHNAECHYAECRVTVKSFAAQDLGIYIFLFISHGRRERQKIIEFNTNDRFQKKKENSEQLKNVFFFRKKIKTKALRTLSFRQQQHNAVRCLKTLGTSIKRRNDIQHNDT